LLQLDVDPSLWRSSFEPKFRFDLLSTIRRFKRVVVNRLVRMRLARAEGEEANRQ
jgi:hypothetical protein